MHVPGTFCGTTTCRRPSVVADALSDDTRASERLIPPRANRKTPRECDFALYCECNLVERIFNVIKHFRANATRYEKTARNVLAGVHLVCALAWLK